MVDIRITLIFEEGRAYDEFNADPSKIYDGDVNGRPVVMLKETLEGASKGDCDISMKVGESARVFAAVTFRNRDTEQACSFAEKLAKKIEPNLPEDNG